MESVQIGNIIQMATVCISAFVAVISLVLSILTHMRQKPKLQILIPDPAENCFYGWRQLDSSGNTYTRVAYIYICLINNSPVAVGAENITISIKGKRLQRILPDNDYWNDTVLFYRDNEKLIDPGTSLNYSEVALRFPVKVAAYNTANGVVLFHNFPSSVSGNCHIEVVMQTAIGKVKKRIRMHEYNRNVINLILRDVDDFNGSIEQFEL